MYVHRYLIYLQSILYFNIDIIYLLIQNYNVFVCLFSLYNVHIMSLVRMLVCFIFVRYNLCMFTCLYACLNLLQIRKQIAESEGTSYR